MDAGECVDSGDRSRGTQRSRRKEQSEGDQRKEEASVVISSVG
jgi:hypothetical protein